MTDGSVERDPDEMKTVQPILSPQDIRYGPDRRDLRDRRKWDGEAEFPLIDCSGELILEDRRKIPDRRLSNISVLE